MTLREYTSQSRPAVSERKRTLSLAIHKDVKSVQNDVVAVGKRIEELHLRTEQLQSRAERE